jgi:hypothetical protein
MNDETTQTSQKITIVGTVSGASRDSTRDIVERATDVVHVRENFERFLRSLKEILDVEVPHIGAFELDEVAFSAEISASGDFKLLGVGVGIEANGGVIFTLRQKSQK